MTELYRLDDICQNISVTDSEAVKLNVLFFGATADVAGSRSTVIEVPFGATSREALDEILRRHPGLSSRRLLYSLNQTYANGDEQLNSGDELAVFTAVSGG